MTRGYPGDEAGGSDARSKVTFNTPAAPLPLLLLRPRMSSSLASRPPLALHLNGRKDGEPRRDSQHREHEGRPKVIAAGQVALVVLLLRLANNSSHSKKKKVKESESISGQDAGWALVDEDEVISSPSAS